MALKRQAAKAREVVGEAEKERVHREDAKDAKEGAKRGHQIAAAPLLPEASGFAPGSPLFALVFASFASSR